MGHSGILLTLWETLIYFPLICIEMNFRGIIRIKRRKIKTTERVENTGEHFMDVQTKYFLR